MNNSSIVNRLSEIDALKGLAIGAVVIIHLILGFGVSMGADDSLSSLFLTINQMALFSVPLFVLWSGVCKVWFFGVGWQGAWGLEVLGKHSYLIYVSHRLRLRLLMDGIVRGSMDVGQMMILALLLLVGIGGSRLWEGRLALAFKERWR